MKNQLLCRAGAACLIAAIVCAPVAIARATDENSSLVTRDNGENSVDAPDVIFSNLAAASGERYNSDPSFGFPIAGVSASGETESLSAIAIIPKVDAQAKVLLVAIAYISGTKLVNVGLYNDDGNGTVGAQISGGQGSTTEMPNAGECCRLARVVLAGAGVSLKAGTRYWLVVSPDDVTAPTFRGTWQNSYGAVSAYTNPPSPWINYPGFWAAAEVFGKRLGSRSANDAFDSVLASSKAITSGNGVALFSNLGPTSVDQCNSFQGSYVAGKSAKDTPEVWMALPFTPRVNSHAKTLAAAIGYVSGTREINLGVYADNAGTVGNVLPDGLASTTNMPDAGDCCGLTRVKLPGSGVTLTKNTQYWLVASPDNVNAPDFEGLWFDSNLAVSAYEEPENFINWTSFTGDWLGARIQGTTP